MCEQLLSEGHGKEDIDTITW